MKRYAIGLPEAPQIIDLLRFSARLTVSYKYIHDNYQSVQMNDKLKTLCDQLAREAGFDKGEMLEGQEREITIDELTALAEAYESKIEFYNWHFKKQLKQPTHPRNLRRVWNATIEEQWGLELKRCIRKAVPVYLIHMGAKG